jgi:hypothetical protein
MNFVRNLVSGIPRVNLYTNTFMEYSTVPRMEKVNKEKKDSKKNNKSKDNIIVIKENNIEKIDNEYLTLKSIEHSLK